MVQIAAGYGLVLICATVIIIADVILKQASVNGAETASPEVGLASALYVASAVIWFLSMRYVSLMQASVAYTMFSLVALCAVGALVYGDPIRLREMAGLTCAVLAVVLLIRAA